MALPRAILGRMERFAFVMLFDALIDVFGKANIIALGMRYGANDVNVGFGRRYRADMVFRYTSLTIVASCNYGGQSKSTGSPASHKE